MTRSAKPSRWRAGYDVDWRDDLVALLLQVGFPRESFQTARRRHRLLIVLPTRWGFFEGGTVAPRSEHARVIAIVVRQRLALEADALAYHAALCGEGDEALERAKIWCEAVADADKDVPLAIGLDTFRLPRTDAKGRA